MDRIDLLKKAMNRAISTPSLEDRRSFFLRGARLDTDLFDSLHLSKGVIQKLEDDMTLRNSLTGMEPKERLLAAKKIVLE
ncbi:hypothetical protein HYU19_03295 [Candidatus Woesearchaeota archaeon]|nr:hypothetical protein [Candidatus Woesearchaeota archaeon]